LEIEQHYPVLTDAVSGAQKQSLLMLSTIKKQYSQS